MKKKASREPRTDRRKERIEALEAALRVGAAKSDARIEELRQSQQIGLRVYYLLDAERKELLARANKLDVIMRSMGIQVPNCSSPASYMPVEF